MKKLLNNVTINGNQMAKNIINDLKNIVAAKSTHNNKPKLGIILAGNNPSSQSYVKKKIEISNKIDIKYEIYRFQEHEESKVKQKIIQLNNNNQIHGILAQLPFPSSYNKKQILELIRPEKDIDCLHPQNLLQIIRFGENAPILPCTPHAILHICDYYNIDVSGKKVLIVGRSNLVGLPISLLMLKRNAIITVAHRHCSQQKLNQLTKSAQIIIVAVGHPNLIKYVNPNCLIFDVGISKIPNSKKIVGDVDRQSVTNFGLYTPVPGGIGPLTVTMLMKNIVSVWEKTL